jgi:hypothetical protein
MWSGVTKRVSVVPVTETGTRVTATPEDEEDDDAVDDDDDVAVPDDVDVDDDAPPLPAGAPWVLEQANEHTAPRGATSRAAQRARRMGRFLSSMTMKLPLLAIESKLQKVGRDALQQYIHDVGER